MNSTGRVGCHAASAGRLVAATAIALAAANAWAITGLILITGVSSVRSRPDRPEDRPANLRQLAAQRLAEHIVCQVARATSAIFRPSFYRFDLRRMNIVVTDRVVHLWGAIDSAERRRALALAAAA